MQSNYKVILASKSPRRTQLLAQAGIEHQIIPSVKEEQFTATLPWEVVEELSAQKAQEVYEAFAAEHPMENVIVLGADTVVAAGEEILGKPKDEADAFRMIGKIQGTDHQVYTGVTLLGKVDGSIIKETFHECSFVDVYPMTEAEICDYLSAGEHMDKAGAYGIQGRFAIYIRGIRGDYNNIVGLPIASIYQRLKSIENH